MFNRYLISIFALLLLAVGNPPTYAQASIYVTPLAWSPDGRLVAITIDDTVQIRDAITTVRLYELVGHTALVTMVAWSPNSQVIATASFDQTVKLWNSADGMLVRTLTGHNEAVTSVIWSLDGQRIISTGREAAINLFVWNYSSGQLLATSQAGIVWDVAYSPDNRLLVYVHGPGISIAENDTFRVLGRYIESLCCSNTMFSVTWSPNGAYIATGSLNGLVSLWDPTTLQIVRQFDANVLATSEALTIVGENIYRSFVRDVAFSPDGSTLMAISGDGTYREWDVATGSLVNDLQLSSVAMATFSPLTGQIAYLDPSIVPALDGAIASQRMITDAFHVIVPAPSSERLQAITDACGLQPAADTALTAEISAQDYTGFTTQLEALPDEALPPGCRADLLAVAAALEGQ